MKKSVRTIAALVFSAALISAPVAIAKPGHGKGHGDGHGDAASAAGAGNASASGHAHANSHSAVARSGT